MWNTFWDCVDFFKYFLTPFALLFFSLEIYKRRRKKEIKINDKKIAVSIFSSMIFTGFLIYFFPSLKFYIYFFMTFAGFILFLILMYLVFFLKKK